MKGIFAEPRIPAEIERVHDLVKRVPHGPDRRFETLARAVSRPIRLPAPW